MKSTTLNALPSKHELQGELQLGHIDPGPQTANGPESASSRNCDASRGDPVRFYTLRIKKAEVTLCFAHFTGSKGSRS
jgi:hypothetical protein